MTVEQRKLLADIREKHPSASVPVILSTLVAEGRLDKDALSASSVRPYYEEQEVERGYSYLGYLSSLELEWRSQL